MEGAMRAVLMGLMTLLPAMAILTKAGPAAAAPASDQAAVPQTLDQAEPPFPGDFTWLNGGNYQPEALLQTGPFTWTLLVDTYYGYSFNAPKDGTVFPTTTAPRHNEFNLNYGLLGVEVTGVPNVLGKLVLQMGNYVDTITGTDSSVGRGAYTGLTNLRNVQQAWLGYHFPVLHGMNLVTGIFPAYIGLESYVPQENWNYTHAVVSDFTPYYLTGASLQLYPRPDLLAQLWLVNGWQSLSKQTDAPGLGWSLNWRPTDRLSLTHNFLGGAFESDPSRVRYYADNVLQWQYARQPLPWIKSLALNATADLGYNTAGTQLPATWLGGGTLAHRVEFNDQWALGLRGSFFADPQKLVALPLPGGQAIPDGALTAAEATATLDFKPVPWLLYRLEYRHDWSSIPYIAGPGGITPPAGNGAGFSPDLRTNGDRLTLNATLRF
jgi:hypothetical protein